ncbi:MAG: efflux RND transporter permease subunit, partial [Saprospiraceae bacterium]
MKISHFFIERPVFASVISLMIIFIGLVSLLDLSVREYPKIDEPVVSVRTDYKGAAPEIIESQITKPLEDSIAGIEGIKTLSSVSRQGRSNITVRFKTYRDPDDAASDVRGRVSRVLNRLPFEAKSPRISKVESDASPIMWMTLTSDEVPLMDLSFIAQNVIKPRIQSLPGAADVRIYGDRKYAMRIWVDANKVAAHDLTVQDIEEAIREQNLEIPAGRIETRGRELSVIASTDLSNPEEFRNIIVPIDDGSNFTRLGDLATVEIGPEDERRVARYKGRPSIALGVIKQATANPLELSKAVNENIP